MLGIPAVSLIANIVEVGLFGAPLLVCFVYNDSLKPKRVSLASGAYTGLFLVCLIVMSSKRSSVNRLLSSAAIIMYILCAICLAIDVARIFQGFTRDKRQTHRGVLYYTPTSPNNAPEYARGYIFTIDVGGTSSFEVSVSFEEVLTESRVFCYLWLSCRLRWVISL
jgi:hypothetical protein